MKRYIFLILVLLLISVVIFYFWASSPSMSEEDHIRIKEYSLQAKEQSDTFSVITYNIGYLSGLINNLAVEREYDAFWNNLKQSYSIVSSLHPDIIGFQEIDFYAERSFRMNQMDSIALNCAFQEGAYAVNWDKHYVPFPYWPPSVHFGNMLSGQGILSKFPVLMNKKIILQKPEENPFWYNAFYLDRLLQISHLDVGAGIIVMNVHLEAFDADTREKQINRVIIEYENYKNLYPVLLIGDFNCEPPYAESLHKNERTIASLLELSDIAQAIPDSIYSESPSDYFTFDSGKPFQKIDYIFYNPSRISCLDAFVIGAAGEISDHLPAYMKFTIKNELH
ncbi:endonuclease/exonuclease/phosphatase family protein [Bacteroidota bacterium]